jgi:hypothetical protein
MPTASSATNARQVVFEERFINVQGGSGLVHAYGHEFPTATAVMHGVFAEHATNTECVARVARRNPKRWFRIDYRPRDEGQRSRNHAFLDS